MRGAQQAESQMLQKFGSFSRGRGLRELSMSSTGPLGDIPIKAEGYAPRRWPFDGAYPRRSPSPSARRPQSARQAPRPYHVDEDGELEISFGWPQWLPVGASSVFLIVECDNGVSVRSDPMDGASWSGAAQRHDRHGSALFLPCRRTSSVTLHVMAESATQPHAAPRSVGGTTVMLPPPSHHSLVSRRLRLLAPLDISVQLSWTPVPRSLAVWDAHEPVLTWDPYHHEWFYAPQPRPAVTLEPYAYKHGMYEWDAYEDSWVLTSQPEPLPPPPPPPPPLLSHSYRAYGSAEPLTVRRPYGWKDPYEEVAPRATVSGSWRVRV